jgi:hypothetical protein
MPPDKGFNKKYLPLSRRGTFSVFALNILIVIINGRHRSPSSKNGDFIFWEALNKWRINVYFTQI